MTKWFEYNIEHVGPLLPKRVLKVTGFQTVPQVGEWLNMRFDTCEATESSHCKEY